MNVKVGDIIEITKSYGTPCTVPIGSRVIVTNISSSGMYLYFTYDGETKSWATNLNDFTVVESSLITETFTKPETLKIVDKGFVGSHNLPIDLDYDNIDDLLHTKRGA